LYLPKWSSLSGSNPSQGGAFIESKLLKGEDGGFPSSLVRVYGKKVRHWLSTRGAWHFASSETSAIGKGGSEIVQFIGRWVIQSGTCMAWY